MQMFVFYGFKLKRVAIHMRTLAAALQVSLGAGEDDFRGGYCRLSQGKSQV